MRYALALASLLPTLPAAAAPAEWTNVPTMIAKGTAPVAAKLQACIGRGQVRTIDVIANRSAGGTAVGVPLRQLGGAMSKEDSCLEAAVPGIALPSLPAVFDRVYLRIAIGAPPPADPAFDAWRDPAGTIAGLLDRGRRAALAACIPRPRIVRVTLDLRDGATRVTLPAWQFAAPGGEPTPPAEAKIERCLTGATSTWRPPALPAAMPQLDVAIAVP